MLLNVYVDVLFIINFICDYILLSVTSFFLKRRVRTGRLITGAAVGALYAALVFFMPMTSVLLLPLSLAISLLMLLITFGAKRISLFFKNIAVFYLVSFVISGAGFALLSLANQRFGINFFMSAGIVYADINAYQLLISFICAVLVLHFACGYIRKLRIKSHFIYNVTIQKNGKEVTDTALLDTGNFLKEPLSQKSVLIAEWETVSKLFPQNTLSECVAENPTEFTYIPCRTVSGRGGLFAFVPDAVSADGTPYPEAFYVGISEKSLDKDGSYRIILPNTALRPERTERM